MHRVTALASALICLFAAGCPAAPTSDVLASTQSFASVVARLSEPPGSFDTDNLISNERSYLQVMPALDAARLRGGAYVGVGPDQNFTYIAQLRPSIAIIVDIRRDNLLLHLLFKALFEQAPTRVEYLSLLFGRAPPPQPAAWRAAPIERLVAYVDRAATVPAAEAARRRDRIAAALARFGVPLADGERDTIHRFHRSFVDGGLDLRFESYGRRPRSYYPTYRDLLLETDSGGRHRNFLASEDDYQFVRSLERRDLIIPVVGNLGGSRALAAIGRLLADRHESLSAFYTSNVEFYLFGSASFPRYVSNLRRLPHTPRSLIIRSVFGGYGFALAPPGSYSASLTEPIDDLIDRFDRGAIRTYGELIRDR
ncbi:MAG: hypothetical protein ACM3SQ_16030 [Betaproteobacteria bacterium]